MGHPFTTRNQLTMKAPDSDSDEQPETVGVSSMCVHFYCACVYSYLTSSMYMISFAGYGIYTYTLHDLCGFTHMSTLLSSLLTCTIMLLLILDQFAVKLKYRLFYMFSAGPSLSPLP